MLENGVIVVGPTTIDKVVYPDRSTLKLGGVTTYAGITFKRHEIKTTLVSNVAPQNGSILQQLYQEGIQVCSGKSRHTTHFIHYTNGDDRRQELPFIANAIQYRQIAALLSSAGLLHLGPLYPTDLTIDLLQQLHDPDLFITLDLQGYVRYRKHHVVYPVVSENLSEALTISKIVKADHKELALILEFYGMTLSELMRCYKIQECVVTLGSQGGVIKNIQGDEIRYNAESIRREVDSTGAGDVFFATYLVYRLFKASNMADAAKCAAKVAAQHIAGKYISPKQLALSSSSGMHVTSAQLPVGFDERGHALPF